MSNEEQPEFTEGSAQSMAIRAMDNARIDAIVAEWRARTDLTKDQQDKEIAARVIDHQTAFDIGKLISIIAVFKDLYVWLREITDEKQQMQGLVYLGYAQIVQHYPDEPEAKAWTAFFNAATTKRDAYNFFVKTFTDEGIYLTPIEHIDGFNKEVFEASLAEELNNGEGLKIS